MIGGSLVKLSSASSGVMSAQMCSGRIGIHMWSSVPRGCAHSKTTVRSSVAVTSSMWLT